MEFGQFLVVRTYQSVEERNSLRIRKYKASLVEHTIFEIGKAVPLITPNGCEGLAVPFEVHLHKYGTIVFFTKVDAKNVTSAMLKAYYQLWKISSGDYTGAANVDRTDKDTRRTGMDAATRLMTGMTRDPDDIADGRRLRVDDDDDDSPSIYDLMKMSNPDDPFFND